ncbi:MAG: CRTAC1 family protein [Acidobacteria bacterium]|nr:CRTAC1 family protein [Acidobacteriota bacterium]MDA1235927.1 CRTAC1 family protein [Acidobacteriota bacterium]
MTKFLLAALAVSVAIGCNTASETAQAPVAPETPVVFTEVSSQAGIDFVHDNGSTGKKWLPETLGSGVAFIDYDADGYPDLFFVNSGPFNDKSGASTSKLYRNNQDGTFTDVTKASGLAVPMYGMGVAFGDYDNDGFDDLYVTALAGDHLFHNSGKRTFTDVTTQAGIRNANFGTSVAFLDYDKDGLLDIFVNNYVQWSPESDIWCTLDGDSKSYCTPESYSGNPSRLYKNLGGGKFSDVATAAGVANASSKALGVAILDVNNDGWPDIFQANDTEPNRLYVNQQDGTFEDIGLTAGVAYAEDGKARGAMGVDSADYDRSGRAHLVVGNFSNEMVNLFHNEGTGLFVDDAPYSEIGRESLLSLTFGMFFFDYDLDGWQDILAANGHLDEQINRVQPQVLFAQSPQVFRNVEGGRFQLANSKLGADLSQPVVARGAAYADYDRDGDLDLVLSINNGPARLFRNDGGSSNFYLAIHLVGERSNRDGFGATVKLTNATGTQTQTARSGSSYCSQSESALTFGLGADGVVQKIEVIWPSGQTQSFDNVAADRRITIHETTGISD